MPRRTDLNKLNAELMNSLKRLTILTLTALPLKPTTLNLKLTSKPLKPNTIKLIAETQKSVNNLLQFKSKLTDLTVKLLNIN